MGSWAFTAGGAGGGLSYEGFLVVLHLFRGYIRSACYPSYIANCALENAVGRLPIQRGIATFVTAVPPRKNTTSRAKNTLHGWMAWTTAVKVATTIPNGVRELLNHARRTRAATAGIATYGCIVNNE